jgi:hypothetical protein
VIGLLGILIGVRVRERSKVRGGRLARQSQQRAEPSVASPQ